MKPAILLLVLGFGLPALASPPDYDRLVANARAYVEMGRIERAVDLAMAAASNAPERPEAYIVWGRALASQDNSREAVEKYERARALGSRDRELFVELSSLYDVLRSYAKAIAVYRDWLDKTPDDAEMHHELGLTCMLAEHFDEAVVSLHRAVVLQPDDLQMRQDLGYALLRRREWLAAESELERVVQNDPKRPEALRLLAQTRAGLGRLSEALPLLDRALALDPKDARTVRVRARLRHLTGDAPGALNDYQTLLALDANDGPALLGEAGALLALDRTPEAAEVIQRASELLHDHPDVRFREAQLAIRRGDRKALARLQALEGSVGNATELWREIAWAAKKFGDQRLAAEAAKHLTEL